MGDPFGDGHPGDGEGPRHRVSLSDFEIATTSVTNEDFAAFVAATGFVHHRRASGHLGGVRHASWKRTRRRGPTCSDAHRVRPGGPKWPGRTGARTEGPGSDVLRPSEATPSSTSAGTTPRRTAPGRGPDCPAKPNGSAPPAAGSRADATRGAIDSSSTGSGTATSGRGTSRTRTPSMTGSSAPPRLGTSTPNGWGLFNTVGNVWEWCADHFDRDYYRRSPQVDPRGPDTGADPHHARRLVPLPRLLLQPVPSGREIVEHAGLLGLEHRVPHRAGSAVIAAFQPVRSCSNRPISRCASEARVSSVKRTVSRVSAPARATAAT
jgi:sulfatase modifying factor 1